VKPLVHICADTPVVAWAEAIDVLRNHSPQFGMRVEIRKPSAATSAQYSALDPANFSNGAKSIKDVATTIFPRFDGRPKETRAAFFKRNAPIYARWRARAPQSWGTYYERLTSYGPSRVNQVERSIAALNGWARQQKAALVLHLSGPELDKPKAQGQPCWQFGEFLREDVESLSLLAVYRSHHYFLKALGNFWGLARLMQFVADHCHLKVGRLV
jgi:hypothetical protein